MKTTQKIIDTVNSHVEDRNGNPERAIIFLSYIFVKSKSPGFNGVSYSGKHYKFIYGKNYAKLFTRLTKSGLVKRSPYSEFQRRKYFINKDLYLNQPVIDYVIKDEKIKINLNLLHNKNIQELELKHLVDYTTEMTNKLVYDKTKHNEVKARIKLNTGRIYSTLSCATKNNDKITWDNGDDIFCVDLNCSQCFLLLNEYSKSDSFNSTEANLLFEKIKDRTLYQFITDTENIKSAKKKFGEEFFNIKLENQSFFFSKDNKVSQKFKTYFPSIWKFFKENYVKRTVTSSHIFQRLESNIFISNVLQKCFELKIDAISGHDAIYCREQDIERIKLLITNCFILKYTIPLKVDNISIISKGIISPKEEKQKCNIGISPLPLIYVAPNNDGEMIPCPKKNTKRGDTIKSNTLSELKSLYQTGMTQGQLVEKSGKGIATIKRYWKQLKENTIKPMEEPKDEPKQASELKIEPNVLSIYDEINSQAGADLYESVFGKCVKKEDEDLDDPYNLGRKWKTK